MNKHENPALVIGGGINGLGIIRNLGRKGIDVYCVVDHKNEAVYSKYCKEYFVIPGIEHDLEKLKLFLDEFKHKLRCKTVLFPTSDLAALNTATLMKEMPEYLASLPSKEVIETLVKKSKFYHSLEARKVPHPSTLFSNPGFEEVDKKVSLPVFVKPSISQIFSNKFKKKGFVANSKEELHRYLNIAEEHKIDVMVQEIVPGPATNHYFIDGYIDRNSKPAIVFGRRRIRMWPLSFGNSTICVSVPISEVTDMEETVVEYLVSIGFHGIFSAEFKRDPRDKVGKLLEVNARSWWYNSFPSACGANIIYAAYLDAIGTDVNTIEDYEADVYLIYFTEDIKTTTAMLTQNRFSLRKWLAPMTKKKHWAILAKDDLKPYAMFVSHTMIDVVHSWLHKSKVQRKNENVSKAIK